MHIVLAQTRAGTRDLCSSLHAKLCGDGAQPRVCDVLYYAHPSRETLSMDHDLIREAMRRSPPTLDLLLPVICH